MFKDTFQRITKHAYPFLNERLAYERASTFRKVECRCSKCDSPIGLYNNHSCDKDIRLCNLCSFGMCIKCKKGVCPKCAYKCNVCPRKVCLKCSSKYECETCNVLLCPMHAPTRVYSQKRRKFRCESCRKGIPHQTPQIEATPKSEARIFMELFARFLVASRLPHKSYALNRYLALESQSGMSAVKCQQCKTFHKGFSSVRKQCGVCNEVASCTEKWCYVTRTCISCCRVLCPNCGTNCSKCKAALCHKCYAHYRCETHPDIDARCPLHAHHRNPIKLPNGIIMWLCEGCEQSQGVVVKRLKIDQ